MAIPVLSGPPTRDTWPPTTWPPMARTQASAAAATIRRRTVTGRGTQAGRLLPGPGGQGGLSLAAQTAAARLPDPYARYQVPPAVTQSQAFRFATAPNEFSGAYQGLLGANPNSPDYRLPPRR